MHSNSKFTLCSPFLWLPSAESMLLWEYSQDCIVIKVFVWNLYTWKLLWPHQLDHDSNNWVHSQHGSTQCSNQCKWGKLHLLTSHPKTCTAVHAAFIWISCCTWPSALCFAEGKYSFIFCWHAMYHNWPIQLIKSNEECKWNLTLISSQRHQDVWCHPETSGHSEPDIFQVTTRQFYCLSVSELPKSENIMRKGNNKNICSTF